MSLTKDQASEITALSERITQAASIATNAAQALADARNKLASYLYKLQQESK